MKTIRTFAMILVGVLIVAETAHSQTDEAATAQLQSEALIQAYQREFVFLDNEIRILEQRLEEVRREGAARVNGARDELSTLETRQSNGATKK